MTMLERAIEAATAVSGDVGGSDLKAIVRAVLAAVQEPTQALLDVDCPLGPSHRGGQWRAMTAALLAGEV